MRWHCFFSIRLSSPRCLGRGDGHVRRCESAVEGERHAVWECAASRQVQQLPTQVFTRNKNIVGNHNSPVLDETLSSAELLYRSRISLRAFLHAFDGVFDIDVIVELLRWRGCACSCHEFLTSLSITSLPSTAVPIRAANCLSLTLWDVACENQIAPCGEHSLHPGAHCKWMWSIIFSRTSLASPKASATGPCPLGSLLQSTGSRGKSGLVVAWTSACCSAPPRHPRFALASPHRCCCLSQPLVACKGFA